jgi:hypothetical protein
MKYQENALKFREQTMVAQINKKFEEEKSFSLSAKNSLDFEFSAKKSSDFEFSG